MTIQLTPRHLKLPYVIASKHAPANSNAHEELVSAGNEALVRAARTYDAAKGAAVDTHLYNCVSWAIRNAAHPSEQRHDGRHHLRWQRLASLDEPVGEGDSRGALVPDDAPAPPDLESEEVLARVLSKLPPLDRAAYVLVVGRGLKQREAAERLGCTKQWVAQLVQRAKEKIVRVMRLFGCRRSPHEPDRSKRRPGVTDRQRRASARSRRERAVAERALGRIPAWNRLWYLCDDAARTLRRGPTLAGAARLAGLQLPTVRGANGKNAARALEAIQARGLRAIRGPEARRLAEYEGFRLLEETTREPG